MSAGVILFWIMAALSVLTAIAVVLHRNPGRSALLLVLNFCCLAVFYFMLNAQVLAALQILVYAGAIMVLFLFIIMLLNLGGELATTDPLVGQRFVGLVLSAALLGGLAYGINYFAAQSQPPGAGAIRAEQAQAQGVSQVQIIGWDMFTRYVYPFELTSILLLVGVIGVVLFTQRRGDTEAAVANDGRRS
jgi:NADH-quinone oxidoreductase subunit J